MKRIRSLANSPRPNKHEKPNRAKVKKKPESDATVYPKETCMSSAVGPQGSEGTLEMDSTIGTGRRLSQ